MSSRSGSSEPTTRTWERTNETVEANGGLVARLLAEEQGLVLDAKLTWAQSARRELEALFRTT